MNTQESNSNSRRVELFLVDDDPDVLTAGRLLLERHYSHIETFNDPQSVPAPGSRPRVMLLDMNFTPGESSGQQGLRWLKRFQRREPDTVFVMVTAHGDTKTAVDAMKLGATDFVSKPWQNDRFVATVSAAAMLAATRFEARQLRERNSGLNEASASAVQPIIGSSAAMQKVLTLIERAAPSDANVLILGENGTGKDLIARAIHRASSRAQEAFLAIDLGAVPESLFESELFGHRKGAFTGADHDRVGRFVAAHGGSLFLDEIGNVPLHLQAKLLGALELRSVTPVGSAAPQAFDVRLISATNMAPRQLQDSERFRADLLYRLNTIEIRLPPLRERREDIPDLVRHYVPHYERRYGKPAREIPEAVLTSLSNNDWPGNVRALRHAVERAVILADTSRQNYEPRDFSLADSVRPAPSQPPSPTTLNLENLEREAIHTALRKHGFNISHTAKELGLTRAALYRRMEKHDL